MKRKSLPFDLSSILVLSSWAEEQDSKPTEISHRCQAYGNELHEKAQQVLTLAEEKWAAGRAALSVPRGEVLGAAQGSSSLFRTGWHMELAARRLFLIPLVLGMNAADEAAGAAALALSQEIIRDAVRTCCDAAAIFLGQDLL